MPKTELTHALGYNVDKQLRIGNDLAGCLQELSRHNAQGVDGAGRFGRELQNRRRTGRNRAGKETRAEHRDDNEPQKVGSLVAVVKRFLQYPRVIATLERVSSAYLATWKSTILSSGSRLS